MTLADTPWQVVDGRLMALADHLAPSEADRLRRLLAADAAAHTVIELTGRAERAEDLVRELRRQLTALDRQVNRLRASTAR